MDAFCVPELSLASVRGRILRPHVTLPTERTLRSQRRWLACGLIMIGLLIFISLAMAQTEGGRSPLGPMLAGIAALSHWVWLRLRVETLERQRRQLASYGRRFAPLRLRTELARSATGSQHYVVVALWTGPNDVQHSALSDGFDYDPFPLLERDRIQVLADPFHPKLAVVPEDTLPPLRWWELDADRRRIVNDYSPVNPWMMWLMPKLFWLVIATIVVGPFLFLYALKRGWV
jgi:hypothetical protein